MTISIKFTYFYGDLLISTLENDNNCIIIIPVDQLPLSRNFILVA